ncbi:MAG: DUF448 domain-containing protein [Epsilonproteobacteria bacterium]|nr:DUF448 domain-containing protein [Campylobacterota bacterium]
MCVVCKSRLEQSSMLRLQCKSGIIVPFNGVGRSFYICNSCKNNKKLGKILQKICKNTQKDSLVSMLDKIINKGDRFNEN